MPNVTPPMISDQDEEDEASPPAAARGLLEPQ
jgi:hypothetical protein